MKFIRSNGTHVDLDEQEPAFVAGGPEGSGETTLDLLSSSEMKDLLEWARIEHAGVPEDEAIALQDWPGWRKALATHQSRVIVATMSMRELIERLARQ
jgi:hypothetical protein